MPEVSIRPPAKMKSGIASNGKLDAPEKRFNGTTLSDAVPFQRRKRMVVIERPNPIGTLNDREENDYSEDEPLHAASAPFPVAATED